MSQAYYEYQNLNKRAVGADYEKKAADYLESIGFTIIARNYFCRIGEIDLVCKETVSVNGKSVEYLVFTEVKYRSSHSKGYAAEAVGKAKQQKIYQCAQVYMKQNKIPLFYPVRFDVVAIDAHQIRLIRNAIGCM